MDLQNVLVNSRAEFFDPTVGHATVSAALPPDLTKPFWPGIGLCASGHWHHLARSHRVFTLRVSAF